MNSKFTAEAKVKWDLITPEIQKALLSNVWCPNCSKIITIEDFQGRVEMGDLILTSICSTCGGNVARVIESE